MGEHAGQNVEGDLPCTGAVDDAKDLLVAESKAEALRQEVSDSARFFEEQLPEAWDLLTVESLLVSCRASLTSDQVGSLAKRWKSGRKMLEDRRTALMAEDKEIQMMLAAYDVAGVDESQLGSLEQRMADNRAVLAEEHARVIRDSGQRVWDVSAGQLHLAEHYTGGVRRFLDRVALLRKARQQRDPD